MSDYLQTGPLRNIVKTLKIPVPVILDRAEIDVPIKEDEFWGRKIKIDGTPESASLKASFKKKLDERGVDFVEGEGIVEGLVYIALAPSKIADLKPLYTFINANLKSVKPNGRVIIVAKNWQEGDHPEQKAALRSLIGFTKALAKECGGFGTTVQLVYAEAPLFSSHTGFLEKVLPVVHFFLSKRSSFITGQVIEVKDSGVDENVHYYQSLQGKIAIVTGGARGIGGDTVKCLAREGAKVVIVDVPAMEKDGKQLAEQVGGDFLAKDITTPTAPKEIRDYIIANYGNLDILVNNAGVIRDKMIVNMKPEQWDLVLNVNLEAAIRLTEAFLEIGMNQNGRIIGLSSINGIAGAAGQTNYSASKAGLIGYIQAIAEREWMRGITANAIAPGFIETQMTENLPFFIKEGGRRLSALKQGGLPIDIAETITFLSSPMASGISGQVLRVCGGNFVGA
ncbi:MAG: 3-oxoacyl-ACP reductase [Chitinophagales bacterium]|nr:3-oxoacyl-ACP reductase [Chitinophagales bacterium]